MNDFNIQAASLMSGVTVHQIRAWEKRYQTVVPTRLANNYRSYSRIDIKKLKLLGLLTNTGISISKIASLSVDELQLQYDFSGLSDKAQESKTDSGQTNEKVDFLLSFLVAKKSDIFNHELLKFQKLNSVSEVIIPLIQKILLQPNLNEFIIQGSLSTLTNQINRILDKTLSDPNYP